MTKEVLKEKLRSGWTLPEATLDQVADWWDAFFESLSNREKIDILVIPNFGVRAGSGGHLYDILTLCGTYPVLICYRTGPGNAGLVVRYFVKSISAYREARIEDFDSLAVRRALWPERNYAA
jgi:hypothetical protein